MSLKVVFKLNVNILILCSLQFDLTNIKTESTDNPVGSVQLIKLMIDLSTFHTFKIIIFKIVLVLAVSDEKKIVGI
jgi:hypothetical protein